MDKAKAQKMFELADRLSKVNVNELNEAQRTEYSTMVAKLQEEAAKVKEAVTTTPTGLKHTAKPGQYGNDDKQDKTEPQLNKSQTIELDRALDVHWKKKPGRGRYGEVDVEESTINTEAYDRLKRVFDFSDYKG